MRKVALVRPPMLNTRHSFTGLTVPPLGLAYIASAVRKQGHDVRLIDSVGEGVEQYILYNDNYILHGLKAEQILERIPADVDFIGVSCMFSHEFPTYRTLLAAIKERFPKVPLIAGGEHITAMTEDTFLLSPDLDVAVLGEGEETFLELIARGATPEVMESVPGLAWRDGKGGVRFSKTRARVKTIDDFQWPAWDLVPLNNYWKFGMGLGVYRGGKSMPMLATRGCPYQCTFCSNPTMWTTKWVPRKPLEVVKEMKHYQDNFGATNFDFYDLTAIITTTWIKEFCQGILDMGLKLTFQLPSGTRTEAINQEVAHLLFASGCRNMTFAPESGSPDTLKRIKKRIKVDNLVRSLKDCRREGLNVKANIIVGFPDDTRRDLWITYRFILRMAVAGLNDVTIQPFSAYPGSELFRRLRAEKKIPVLDDQYFFALADYSDLGKAVSWSEHLTAKGLIWFRTIGMLSFYALSYSLRPWRFTRLVYNLIKGRQESRIERALSDIFKRRYTLAPDLAPATKLQAAVSAVALPPYI